MLQEIQALLQAVRLKKPLIHQITNYVTANDCANATLAAGASPVMAQDIGEVEEMAGGAAALVLNIGTLSTATVAAMLAAGKRARELGAPVVFDPVGVGATAQRTRAAAQIIETVRPTVVRGNVSEIKTLCGLDTRIRGVDAGDGELDSAAAACRLARRLDGVVAVTGKTDLIADATRIYRIDNGHPLLTSITGSGCMATALVGALLGVAGTERALAAAAGGVMMMGIAGELAQASLREGEGVGTFRARLFDALGRMDAAVVQEYGRIRME